MSQKPVSKEAKRLSGLQPLMTQKTLFPVSEREVDGVGMGVLDDGTPFLTMRGLARLCGVDHMALSRLVNNWTEEQQKPRGKKISDLLASQGYSLPDLFLTVRISGADTFAFPDSVCMAILEYYAFEASQGSREQALANFRYLARVSFRTFIYNTCGYDPRNLIPESWKTYHARVLLNDQIPIRYFSIFREIAEIVIHMIQGGCAIDSSTVPDISVGKTWSNYWTDSNLADKYGERQQFGHVFPDWFPQAMANPVPAYIYPIESLGTFRSWLYENYIPQKFPTYINSKVKQGKIGASSAELLLISVNKNEIKRIG